MCRLATKTDRPALLCLWQNTFGDDEGFIARCLDDFAGREHVYVAPAEQGISAMLLAVPCKLGEEKGNYLYALATNPNARGQGVMTGLMQYAESAEKANGAAFAALIPASQALYRYYEKRGYTQKVLLRQLQYTAPPVAAGAYHTGKAEFTSGSAGELAVLRASFCKMPYISFSPRRFSVIWDDLRTDNIQIAKQPAGYVVYFKNNTGLYVPELFADSEETARNLLDMLCAKTGHISARVTTAPGNAFFQERGTAEAAGLVKSLTGKNMPGNIYLRFGKEGLPASFS